ncbi:MAG: DUF58 domain-containing protein [Spirochaetota bacterium]
MNSILDETFLKKLETLSLLAGSGLRGERIGRHRSYRRGNSLEFYDRREYQQGDDFRYIDWSIYTRLKRTMVKMFHAEEEMTVHLFIDTSASMGYGTPSKLQSAGRIAAALAYIAVAKQDRVKIIPVTEIPHAAKSAGPAKGSVGPLFNFIASLQSAGSTDLAASLQLYAQGERYPGLAIVLSDLLSPAAVQEGLSALLFRGFEILLIQILHPDEMRPPLTGSSRLVDMESGEQLSLEIDQGEIAEYRRILDSYSDEIGSYCIERGIEFIRTSSEVAMEDIIFEYLKRGIHLK